MSRPKKGEPNPALIDRKAIGITFPFLAWKIGIALPFFGVKMKKGVKKEKLGNFQRKINRKKGGGRIIFEINPVVYGQNFCLMVIS